MRKRRKARMSRSPVSSERVGLVQGVAPQTEALRARGQATVIVNQGRRTLMEKIPINETTAQLLKSLQEANQAVVEGIVAAQERNVKVPQSILTNWIETLKKQGEHMRTLCQEVGHQSLEQQEALQKVTYEAVESYFNFLRASLPSYPPSLRLEENLRICLLALASRYPRHIVDINEELLGFQSLAAEGWTVPDLIDLFQSTAPELLQAKARLEVNAQSKGIYLLERSEQTPTFWVHCGEPRERIPAYQGNRATRQQQQTARGEEVPALVQIPCRKTHPSSTS